VRLTNDCYLVTLEFSGGEEHYFRDGETLGSGARRHREASVERVRPSRVVDG
jgi:hypothetical protein